MKCFICNRKLGRKPALVVCQDDQTVYIGRECYKLVANTGKAGYQPEHGPRLYLIEHDPRPDLPTHKAAH